MVCINSFGRRFSLAAVGLLLPCERPLLLIVTSKPPRPLFTVVDTVVVVETAGFVANKLPPVVEPNKDAVRSIIIDNFSKNNYIINTEELFNHKSTTIRVEVVEVPMLNPPVADVLDVAPKDKAVEATGPPKDKLPDVAGVPKVNPPVVAGVPNVKPVDVAGVPNVNPEA